jgi:hypothetical protein
VGLRERGGKILDLTIGITVSTGLRNGEVIALQ